MLNLYSLLLKNGGSMAASYAMWDCFECHTFQLCLKANQPPFETYHTHTMNKKRSSKKFTTAYCRITKLTDRRCIAFGSPPVCPFQLNYVEQFSMIFVHLPFYGNWFYSLAVLREREREAESKWEEWQVFWPICTGLTSQLHSSSSFTLELWLQDAWINKLLKQP